MAAVIYACGNFLFPMECSKASNAGVDRSRGTALVLHKFRLHMQIENVKVSLNFNGLLF